MTNNAINNHLKNDKSLNGSYSLNFHKDKAIIARNVYESLAQAHKSVKYEGESNSEYF